MLTPYDIETVSSLFSKRTRLSRTIMQEKDRVNEHGPYRRGGDITAEYEWPLISDLSWPIIIQTEFHYFKLSTLNF
jgi:hypothetical protein